MWAVDQKPDYYLMQRLQRQAYPVEGQGSYTHQEDPR
jgi:hypothetical protein